MRREVLLYYPEYEAAVARSKLLELPLSILQVAGPLERAGYSVEIVDGRRAKAHSRLTKREHAPLWLGVICSLGQLADALQACEAFRRRFNEVPIIFGGRLPTVHPQPFLSHRLVTAIVRGPGEKAACEISLRLEGGEEITAVPGVTVCGAAGCGPPAPLHEPSLLLPLHLLDHRKYEIRAGRIDLETSRGCRPRCAFRASATIHAGQWCGLGAQEILSGLTELAARHDIRRVRFVDDSFFHDLERVLEMARGIVFLGLDLRWTARGALDDLLNLTDQDWTLLQDSGCAVVSSGITSGDPAVRQRLGGSFDNEQLLALGRRLEGRGILFAPLFLLDSPEEPDESLRATFMLMERLAETCPESRPCFSACLYDPVPGTPLFAHEAEKGLLRNYPTSLEALTAVIPADRSAQAPWLPREQRLSGYRSRRSVQVRAFYFFGAVLSPALRNRRQAAISNLVRGAIHALFKLRVRTWCFRLPVEWYVYRAGSAVRRWLSGKNTSNVWRRRTVDLKAQGDSAP